MLEAVWLKFINRMCKVASLTFAYVFPFAHLGLKLSFLVLQFCLGMSILTFLVGALVSKLAFFTRENLDLFLWV